MPVASDLGMAPDLYVGTTQVRVAHLIPDAAAIDVCISPHGAGMFQGPMLKQAGVDKTGLAYAQATRYLTLPALQYDYRIVDGAATSCAQSLGDATEVPAPRANAKVTVAAIGLLHPPSGNQNTFAVKVYLDDWGMASGPMMAWRFIHASPDTAAVDVGVGSGNQFTLTFANVGYGQAGQTSSANPNGYVMMPLPDFAPRFSARMHGSSDDALTFTTPTAPAMGDAYTAFLIGDFGGKPQPFRTLVCTDNSPPSGALANCAVRP